MWFISITAEHDKQLRLIQFNLLIFNLLNCKIIYLFKTFLSRQIWICYVFFFSFFLLLRFISLLMKILSSITIGEQKLTFNLENTICFCMRVNVWYFSFFFILKSCSKRWLSLKYGDLFCDLKLLHFYLFITLFLQFKLSSV